jgi:hypothetical protein
MTGTKNVTVNPWLNQRGTAHRFPQDARFVCEYDLYLGIDTIPEKTFIRRTDDQDELWIATELGLGPAVVAPREGNQADAAQNLLGILFRSRVGFAWPSDFVSGWIVDKAAFDLIVSNINGELDDNAEKAQKNLAEIVITARHLGLSPTPGGKTPDHWLARCPETSHHLRIDAAANVFGCGWCKRKGGPGELRAFFEERRKWKQELSEGDDSRTITTQG